MGMFAPLLDASAEPRYLRKADLAGCRAWCVMSSPT